MNRDIFEGRWKQLKGQAKQKWGELTDDDVEAIEGRQEELVGRVQARYGIAREEAKREVDAWIEGH